MPWAVRKEKGGKPYKIVKKTTGRVVGSSKTKAAAQASVRARYAAEGGYKMGKKRGR